MKKRTPPPKQINQYIFSAELGSGGYATVYKAFNKDNRRMYACKVFPKSNLIDKTEEEHFQREIDTMAIINHPGIVCLHDFFWDDNNFYLIMDFCQGGSLFDYILKKDKLDEPTAAHIFKQVVTAIAHCHSLGVAHRDLKPENILIDKFPHILLADFGLCGFTSQDYKMLTFCGSACYCSPECLAKTAYDGPSSDIWSLGVLLYVLVSGDTPWPTKNTPLMLRAISAADYTMPPVSQACREVIAALLNPNPYDRPTAEAILEFPWVQSGNDISRTPLPPIITAPPPPHSISGEKLSINALSQAYKADGEKEHGIISPFEARLPLGAARAPSLPKLRVKPAATPSFLPTIGEESGPSLILQKSKYKTNLSISGNRQLSGTFLLSKTLPN